ncbi:MAG: oxidoreductase [Betaproteobacteria bacterium RIFCSPLOWO2_12_FULL_68_20]|nr:MAG: oxidoreductase [Betaproteobacteria bacterium RIFCSPLOWO2_12_FULL_68_20]
MRKWNLVIDVARCCDCNLCALACHDEYYGNEFPGYAAEMAKHGQRWIDIRRKERGAYPMVDVAYLPVTCNHCDDPPCLKAARDGAVVKRPDGIVLIVPEKAKGQRQIAEACPYGAAFWNEAQQLPQAWPFDAHLIDSGWTQTRGAQVCPTRAMRSVCVSDEEMQAMARREGLETLRPELGTKPRVYYKNLDRWRKAFVGGSLAGPIGGVNECAAGVRVALEKDGRTLAETVSDDFGDWRVDGLGEGSGRYRVSFSDPRFATQSLELELGASRNLGTIQLRSGD